MRIAEACVTFHACGQSASQEAGGERPQGCLISLGKLRVENIIYLPESIVHDSISLQEWKQFFLHATCDSAIVALVYGGFDVVVRLADFDDTLEEPWRKVRDAKLEDMCLVE